MDNSSLRGFGVARQETPLAERPIWHRDSRWQRVSRQGGSKCDEAAAIVPDGRQAVGSGSTPFQPEANGGRAHNVNTWPHAAAGPTTRGYWRGRFYRQPSG